MSRLQIYADLSAQRLTTEDGSPITLPTQVLGDTMRIELRLLDRYQDGELREIDLPVRSVRVSLGPVMAPPTGGTFSFRAVGPSGTGTTGAIMWDTNAETFQSAAASAFTAAGLVLASVRLPAPACWLLSVTGGTHPLTIEAVTNTLAPDCFVRITPFEVRPGEWLYEIRLIQAPYAFTGTHQRILPDAPSIIQVREGRGPTPSEPAINEVQGIKVPPAFRGTYAIAFNGRETRPFTIEDGPADTAEALNALYTDGLVRFSVTQGELDTGYIEFIGDLGGAPQPDLTVRVLTHPEGVITLDLPLDRHAMHAALRNVAQVRVPLEIEFEVVDDPDDIDDPGVSGRRFTFVQPELTVIREQIWDGMDLVPAHDFLRPPSPVSYQPPTTDQVLVGVQLTHRAVRGDGSSREIDVDHALASTDIESVTVLDAEGRAKVHGLDFDWRVVNANRVRVSVAAGEPTPALNAWTILVKAPGPLNAYQAHTHAESDIVGLAAWKASVTARLATLEGMAPSTPLTLPSNTGAGGEITIPRVRGFFAGRYPKTFNPLTAEPSLAALPRTITRRPPTLLRAHHDASVTDFPGPDLPSNPSEGVYRYTGSGRVLVPGSSGRPSSRIGQNEFVAWDGRVWHRVSRDQVPADTRSYFPADYEIPLLYLPIGSRMQRAGFTLSFAAELKLALLAANTSAKALLVAEVGQPLQVSGGSPPAGENLERISWTAAPVFSVPIGINATPITHKFGLQIVRAANGSFSTNAVLYGKTEASTVLPPAADYVLRARLIQFDTEDPVTDPRGVLFYEMPETKAQIA